MADQTLTAHGAKKLLRAELERRGLPVPKLTARSWDFTDLAREKCVFVTLHTTKGIDQDTWTSLKAWAVENGFRIQT